MVTSRVRGHARLSLGVLCVLLIVSPVASAQGLAQNLERIFNSADFAARDFGPAEWVDHGAAYLTVEPSESHKEARDIVRYETATGKREILVAASALVPVGASAPLRIEQYAFSPDKTRVLIYTNSQKVWRQNTRGDYWVFDRGAGGSAGGSGSSNAGGSAGTRGGALRKLGGDTAAPASLMFATFSPDGKLVAYVRDHNLFVEDVATGAITPLTSDGSATIINGTSDWVYEEEFDLRNGFRWSPDSSHLAYWRFDSTGVGAFSLIHNTAGTYPTVSVIPYPKAGTTNSAVTIGVVSATGGQTMWIDLPGDARQSYVPRMDWADNSRELILQHLNRLQNRNDVLLADVRTGQVRELFHDRDDAWVDVVDEFKWLHRGTQFLWLSERDGWRRIYVATKDSGQLTPVSAPGVDVMRLVATDSAGEWVYYLAAPPDDKTRRRLFRSRVDGKGKGKAEPQAEAVTPADARGVHNYQVSEDGKWAFHVWSTFDRPPVTELVRLPSHDVVRVLEDNHALRDAVAPLEVATSEFFKVDVEDKVVEDKVDDVDHKVALDGWMLKPPGFDPAKKYPVVTYVYGEPAAATVTDAWGGKRALFHRALANSGYIVLSFDNRGTPSPKGRAWRKVIYGEVGVLSASEQAAAMRAFASTRPYVDTSRMAIWGWSGGGSNTLNVMFRSPGLYQVGVSVAPVADQRLYDTIYQERYMGLPEQNADGYRVGSPINFAEGLQGRLLIVHGSGDDNVHIQGTEFLVNRLIQLAKPFDYFVYPDRTHAIGEGPGTSLHVHKLIARYIEEHLAAPASSTRP
jgi:dipeptidyl-peptidase-4